MVLVGDLLRLSRALNAALYLHSDESEALTRSRSRATSIPLYAASIKDLHHALKRAKRVIENRDASVAVPHTELHSILAKVENLEKQVKAVMNWGDACDMDSCVLGAVSEPTPTSNKGFGADGAGDEDCDVQNLLVDLGAKAIDTEGQVSGHSLFRRNSYCSTGSIVDDKKGRVQGVPSGLPSGSEAADSAAANGGSALSSAEPLVVKNNTVPLHCPNGDGCNVSLVTSDSVPSTFKAVPTLRVPKEKIGKDVGRPNGTTVTTTIATEIPLATSTSTRVPQSAIGSQSIVSIVGGVIGSLALICGCVIAVVYLRRDNTQKMPSSPTYYTDGSSLRFV